MSFFLIIISWRDISLFVFNMCKYVLANDFFLIYSFLIISIHKFATFKEIYILYIFKNFWFQKL